MSRTGLWYANNELVFLWFMVLITYMDPMGNMNINEHPPENPNDSFYPFVNGELSLTTWILWVYIRRS